MSESDTDSTLSLAKQQLEFSDLTTEFPELPQSKYKQVVYLNFTSAIDVNRILLDFNLILREIPSPSVFIIDVISYQDMYSITHALDGILEAQRGLSRGKHYQFTLISPTSKFIATMAQKIMRLASSKMDFTFNQNKQQALSTAMTKIHTFLSHEQ